MKKEGILFSVFAPVFKSGLNLMKIHIDHMSIYKHYKTIAMYCCSSKHTYSKTVVFL